METEDLRREGVIDRLLRCSIIGSSGVEDEKEGRTNLNFRFIFEKSFQGSNDSGNKKRQTCRTINVVLYQTNLNPLLRFEEASVKNKIHRKRIEGSQWRTHTTMSEEKEKERERERTPVDADAQCS